ncbi:uncharacterized protein BO66DRAFT_425476 [Aspergillus aculeatinus CBS 121060]|uniref:Uncharacterized protein n=1 Tax=Aspergillus aculeatinus CBS 121060 TaxID=1448322 RepID=A0ACD1HLI9_9EURO|nr:hypothetical protein BO66DRAFT_425476 [Aspergillus aculeatinus CBS 121060]RAH74474.1 hypothetical protein BO66DRAFT_425476 [Aspergillus aculeatinus CBS 121060]
MIQAPQEGIETRSSPPPEEDKIGTAALFPGMRLRLGAFEILHTTGEYLQNQAVMPRDQIEANYETSYRRYWLIFGNKNVARPKCQGSVAKVVDKTVTVSRHQQNGHRRGQVRDELSNAPDEARNGFRQRVDKCGVISAVSCLSQSFGIHFWGKSSDPTELTGLNSSNVCVEGGRVFLHTSSDTKFSERVKPQIGCSQVQTST